MAKQALRRTPLYEEHRSAGAKLVDFAGWEVPIQYAGIKAEHNALCSSPQAGRSRAVFAGRQVHAWGPKLLMRPNMWVKRLGMGRTRRAVGLACERVWDGGPLL